MCDDGLGWRVQDRSSLLGGGILVVVSTIGRPIWTEESGSTDEKSLSNLNELIVACAAELPSETNVNEPRSAEPHARFGGRVLEQI